MKAITRNQYGSADKLRLKPHTLSFEEAAALPQASCIALQGIVEKGNVKADQHILINGGGGSSGLFAIQIAKQRAATVTAVDNITKQQLMLNTGADFVINYEEQDFTRQGKQYDYIFDLAAAHALLDYKRALKSGAKYVMVGGSMRSTLQLLFPGIFLSLFSHHSYGMLALKTNKGLDVILDMIEADKLKLIIDKTFPLGNTPDALRYFMTGKTRGKLIIKTT